MLSQVFNSQYFRNLETTKNYIPKYFVIPNGKYLVELLEFVSDCIGLLVLEPTIKHTLGITFNTNT